MKQTIKLGLVCLARETYDFKASAELFTEKINQCKKIENIEWTIIDNQIFSVEEAKIAANKLASMNLDAFVCISGTFHLGHLVLELFHQIKKPVLLWGLPELPYNGGKIRLNSVCGVNLDASNLYKSGVDCYHTIIDKNIDENWIDAIRVIAAIDHAKIGIAGYRAQGFFNLSVSDTAFFEQTGILIDHYELNEIFSFPIEEEKVKSRIVMIKQTFDCSALNEYQINKVAELCEKISMFYKQKNLSALAIRCWPEFARDFGVSPCATMSILQAEGLLLACEGDVEGSLSMIAHKALGAETPFLFDFSQVDFEKQYALFWHCGVAPCNLWDGKCTRSLDTYFAGGKGVTAGFVCKSGEVSVARIDSARGKHRLFIQKANAVPMEKELAGTYLKAIFNKPVKEVLNLLLDNGIAHHASVVFGNYMEPLRIAAKLSKWEVIE